MTSLAASLVRSHSFQIEYFVVDYFSPLTVDCGQTFIKKDFETYSATLNGKIYDFENR